MANVLNKTVTYLGNKVRLPVVKEKFFYPTESSVMVTEPNGTLKVLGTCIRQAYYRYMGEVESEPYTEYTQWIFFSGNALEDKLIDTWKEMGIWIDNNIKFLSGEHHVSGELDCVIKLPEDDHPTLCEIKTWYGYEAGKALKGNPKKGIAGVPKDQNLLQILVYLYLHQDLFPRGKLIYLDKTCQDNIEFDIQLAVENDKTYPVINGIVSRRFSVEDVFARYKQLKVFVDSQTLPEREFELKYSDEKIEDLWATKQISKTAYEEWTKGKRSIGDWNCLYCKFKKECWKE